MTMKTWLGAGVVAAGLSLAAGGADAARAARDRLLPIHHTRADDPAQVAGELDGRV